jgi:uncharacterized protein YceH (UPF0502 family)
MTEAGAVPADRTTRVDVQLTPLEARVIGCLVEKQITTPDQYPLSLNALVNACNQKSNRDPVLALAEADVQRVVDVLTHRHYVVEKSGFGSRVPKYQQRFCHGDYGVLQLSPQALAVLTELLLRGPQTPGELRARAGRMAEFVDVGQVEAALESLARHDRQPLVVQLPREPGRRESRYAHTLSGPVDARAHAAATAAQPGADGGSDERLAYLEDEVRRLRTDLDELRRSLGVTP